MAVTISGEVQLAAAREVVWAKLNDLLNPCSPACEDLNMNSPTGFQPVAERGNRLILLAD